MDTPNWESMEIVSQKEDGELEPVMNDLDDACSVSLPERWL